MALTPILYNSFNLNDGINYVTLSKNVGFPAINPSTFKIGRLEGMKKVGENINERKISLTVRVIGVSRADLENKIDAMQNALWQRGGNLYLHTNDNRYFIVDCVDCKYNFGVGQIVSVTAQLDFIAYTPFAFASTQSSYDTGIFVMPSVGTQLGPKSFSQSFAVVGGGNVYTRPVITITNQQPFMQVTLTSALTLNVNYTSINVTAVTQPLYQGDDLIIQSGTTKQSVVVAASVSAGATTIPVGGFLPNITFAIGSTVTRDSTINAIFMNQTTDQQVLEVSSLLPNNYGDDLVINCDPLSTNGYTAILNAGSTISSISGSFPVLEPTETDYTFVINANSVPQLEIVWNWNTRWLA
jgi:hypothetical protein